MCKYCEEQKPIKSINWNGAGEISIGKRGILYGKDDAEILPTSWLFNSKIEVLEDNTEEIEEKSNFENMGYEIVQAYFEFYKGIAKALTEKRKESEDK